MQKPVWVFLDFDNTLMATEKLAVPSLVKRFNELYAAPLGRELTVDEFYKHFKGQGRETLCKNLSDYFDTPIDYPTLYKDREAFMVNYLEEQGVEMAPNLLEALGTLKQQGVHFAFASNNPISRGRAAMRFATNGRGHELDALFGEHYFESGDIQKPDPDIYLRAIAKTGADINRSFAVEDSVTGAKSALAAGLKTFGYLGFAENIEQNRKALCDLGVTECFTDWKDFPALLIHYAT